MVTKKPKKPTPNEIAYKKELRRLQAFIRRAQKRGYSFYGYSLPEKPKRVTKKSVDKLKAITPKILYEKSTYYDIISDTRITGTEAQKLIRSRAAKKAAETRYLKKTKSLRTEAGKPPVESDDVLQYVFELIAQWSSDIRWSEGFSRLKEHDKNVMANEIRGAINELGEQQVARNAQRNASEVKTLAWHICYGNSGDKKDGSFNADLVSLLALLKGRSLSAQEAKRLQDRVDTYAYENTQE